MNRFQSKGHHDLVLEFGKQGWTDTPQGYRIRWTHRDYQPVYTLAHPEGPLGMLTARQAFRRAMAGRAVA